MKQNVPANLTQLLSKGVKKRLCVCITEHIPPTQSSHARTAEQPFNGQDQQNLSWCKPSQRFKWSPHAVVAEGVVEGVGVSGCRGGSGFRGGQGVQGNYQQSHLRREESGNVI